MLWTTQRKSHRFHIAVPVRLRIAESGGESFECDAWTLDVSSGGACINIPEGLVVPRRLQLVAEDYQFRASADVEVVWERSFPQRAIGVRLSPRGRNQVWEAR